MKVLEDNNKQKSWKIVCPKCDSVLEYEKEDVVIHESYFMFLHYIQCPCCGKNIDVVHL